MKVPVPINDGGDLQADMSCGCRVRFLLGMPENWAILNDMCPRHVHVRDLPPERQLEVAEALVKLGWKHLWTAKQGA